MPGSSLYTVRLVHELVRPILPQAMEKQGNVPKHVFTVMHSCKHIMSIHIYIHLSAYMPVSI